MSEELSKEEQVLKIMKKIITDIARETHTTPGFKHPLSDQTLLNMRECLVLITAREAELAEAAGRTSKARPKFIDEVANEVIVDFKGKPKNDE